MKQIKHIPTFQSSFSASLQDFLLYKRGCGYSYKSEARILINLDKYFILHCITELTQDAICDWINKRETERYKTYMARNGVTRQYIIYINKHGISAPLPYKQRKSAEEKSFTPYIFTKEQIANVLKAADSMVGNSANTHRRMIFPMLLRLLYCCGLRISEATNLRISDLDISHGLLTIMNSKNDDSRVLPISESLKAALITYLEKMHPYSNDDDLLFPTKKLEQYANSSVHEAFIEILWRTGISCGGRGMGPRVHDLRHTFAVHTLQKLVLEGNDTYLLLPIVSTYLGHKNIYSTEKYLRLTAEMYPNILDKISAALGQMMPEVTNYEDD